MLAIGCDHAGFHFKNSFIQMLEREGFPHTDLGCYSEDSVDYPDIANAVARDVLAGNSRYGVLICRTGIGMSIVANRFAGIRCAVCTDVFLARMAREHNDANVLAIGSDVVGPGLAEEILRVFLNTAFLGGRHAARVNMIDAADRR